MSIPTTRGVPACSVVRPSELPAAAPHPSEPGDGITVTPFLSEASETAAHLTVSVCELTPGSAGTPHLHPFEESFYVLSGKGVVTIADTAHEVVEGDYGLAPIAHGHAWANPFSEPLRWLRVHTPQPRPLGEGRGVYAAEGLEAAREGVPVVELDPRARFVGHFDESDLAPPGQISMPGYHGGNIRSVSIRMMVDELLGARHHTLFVVQFDPPTGPGLSAQEHFHPFEEMYYFLQGSATASFDGERVEVQAGDMVFAPVGGAHGFTNSGDIPVRWIEAQSPLPPASNGFFFHSDWKKLTPLG